MPVDGKSFLQGLEGLMLLVGEGGGGFDQVKLHGGSQKGVMGIDRLEKVGGQKATIAPLLAQGDRRGATQGGVPFIRLPGQKLSQHRAGRNRG